MIEFSREQLFEVVTEIGDLLAMNHVETGSKNGLELSPDWDRYRALETFGALVITTARKDGVLVGYSADVISRHPHYSAELMGNNDVTYLHPDHRGGSNGVRLIKESEKTLKSLGVTYVTRNAKDKTSLATLLPLLKYEQEEIVFGKRL